MQFYPAGSQLFCEPAMSWDCGLRYMFSVSPALQPGSTCVLRDKEELYRLEVIRRLAKDGCRLLQDHKGSERSSEVRRTTTPLQLEHSLS